MFFINLMTDTYTIVVHILLNFNCYYYDFDFKALFFLICIFKCIKYNNKTKHFIQIITTRDNIAFKDNCLYYDNVLLGLHSRLQHNRFLI